MRLLVEEDGEVVEVDHRIALRTLVPLEVGVQQNRKTLLNRRLGLHVNERRNARQVRSFHFPTSGSILFLIRSIHSHSAHNYCVLPQTSK